MKFLNLTFVFTTFFLFTFSLEADARVKKPKALVSQVGAYEAPGDSIHLQWQHKLKETAGYLVEIERSSDGERYLPISRVSLDAAEYFDLAGSLTYDLSYTYRIRFLAPDGDESRWVKSNLISLPRPAYDPVFSFSSSLHSGAPGPGVRLAWTPQNETNPTVILERALEGGFFEEIASLKEAEGFYVDQDVADTMRYRYRVYVAEDASGRQSDPTEEVTIQYFMKRQPLVASPQAILTANGKVEILWNTAGSSGESILDQPFLPLSVVIEKKVNDGEYQKLSKVADQKASFLDAGITPGSEELGEVDGYRFVGNTYQYRLRYETAGDFYARDWQELEPVVVGTPQLWSSEVWITPITKPSEALKVSWQVRNADYQPTVRIERRERRGAYARITTMAESVGFYVDADIDRQLDYQYRLTWFVPDGMALDSEPAETKTAYFQTPEYRAPEAIQIELVEEVGEPAVKFSWEPQVDLSAMTRLEFYQSKNSRDFVRIGDAEALLGEFLDEGVTPNGGTLRKMGAQDVLINTYRYRVRYMADADHKASPWFESKDILVLGPAS